MFQPAISAAVAGRPMPKDPSAGAEVAPTSAATATVAAWSSRIRIGNLAVTGDAPGPDRVVVIEIIVAAHRQKLGKCRLDITGLIDRATLNDGGVPVPVPWQPEAGQRARQL